MKPFFKTRKNLLRAFSVFFSFFIWLYVVSSSEIKSDLEIPIQIQLPKGYMIAAPFPDVMTVNIEGPRVLVKKFLEEKHQLNLIAPKRKLKRAKHKHQFNLSASSVKLPIGLSLTGFYPKKIEVLLEKTIQKKVPVNLRFEQEVKAKLKMKDIKMFPEKILITGPRSLVRSITQIESELITQENILSQTKMAIALIKEDSFLKLEQETVSVSFLKREGDSEFTFMNIPIIFQSRRLVKSASARSVKVQVRGIQKDIESLDKKRIRVIAEAQMGQDEIELRAELPQGLELISLTPSKIKVSVGE